MAKATGIKGKKEQLFDNKQTEVLFKKQLKSNED